MEASHMGNNMEASHIDIAKWKDDNEYKLDREKKWNIIGSKLGVINSPNQ